MGNFFTTNLAALPDSDFGDVINYIRSLTFDNDSVRHRKSDDILKMYIRIVIPTLTFTVSFDSVNDVFSKELTEEEKLEISCQASLILISGVPDEFSYKNPVQSGRRKWNKNNLLDRIETILKELIGGGYAIATTDEVYKILNASTLFTELIEESQE